MKVLLLDSCGQTGVALEPAMAGREPAIDLTSIHGESMIAKPEAALAQIAEGQFDFVINCSTFEQADLSRELHPKHIPFIESLVDQCTRCNVRLIHISSSRVFAGLRKAGYVEEEQAQPSTALGEDLLKLEQRVLQASENNLVLRVGWLFGQKGHGAFDELIHTLIRGGDVYFQAESVRAPTPASDFARVLTAMLLQLYYGAQCEGIYHYGSSEVTSSREFVEIVVGLAEQYGHIDAAALNLVEVDDPDQYDLPSYPILSCNRIREHFGVMQRPWRSALTAIMRQYFQENPTE
ncbi:MAG: sugar nucleotide-binding protein [Pseudomonadales bacterium]